MFVTISVPDKNMLVAWPWTHLKIVLSPGTLIVKNSPHTGHIRKPVPSAEKNAVNLYSFERKKNYMNIIATFNLPKRKGEIGTE